MCLQMQMADMERVANAIIANKYSVRCARRTRKKSDSLSETWMNKK